jgi:hypothetical protein
MFRNGIYKIDYRNPLEDGGACDDALVVVRDGKIIGADRHGGIYTGEPRCFAASKNGPEESIALQLTAPPGGELINGITAGPAGASFELTGRFDPALDRQTTVIDVGGAPIELVVSYLGPLPE